MTKFKVTQEHYTMVANCMLIGVDLLITVTGGDTPHIGVVTTLTKDSMIKTVQFPSHDGRLHKDDFISERVAKRIQPFLPGSATITAGVHVNHISKRQIAASASMSDDLAAQVVNWIKQQPFDGPRPIYYGHDEQPT